jgi:hypothetical protein
LSLLLCEVGKGGSQAPQLTHRHLHHGICITTTHI